MTTTTSLDRIRDALDYALNHHDGHVQIDLYREAPNGEPYLEVIQTTSPARIRVLEDDNVLRVITMTANGVIHGEVDLRGNARSMITTVVASALAAGLTPGRF